MAKTNELQFGVKNVRYAIKDNNGSYGIPKDLAHAHEIALEPTFSSSRIYGDGRVIAEVISDQGKSGTLIVVQIPHEYDKDVRQKIEMTDNSVADITQLDTVEHAIYYEVNKLKNGVNQTIKTWLLNVTSGKAAETFTQSQAEPTINNIEIPLTILGDYALGGSTENVYINTDGNKLKAYRITSKPGDANYASFHESVPTPRISNILGVEGITTAANGQLTRTHRNAGTVVQKVTNPNYSVLRTSLDNIFPFNKIERTNYLNDEMVKLPMIWKSFDGDALKVSDFKEDDSFFPHPLFLNKNGSIAPYVFYNAYSVSEEGSLLVSKPGATAKVETTIGTFRTAAEARGMILSNWKVIDYFQTLFRIKYATINSQSVFRGRVDHSEKGFTGATDMIPGLDGINEVTKQFKFLGVEDLWGNIYEFIDGILFSNEKVYLAYDTDKYQSTTITEDYVEFGPWPQSEGYVTEQHFNPAHKGFEFPKTLGGSSSSWYADYFYVATTGVRIALFGGYWGYGSAAGLWFWLSHLSASYSLSSLGCRFLINPFWGGS